MLIQQNAMISFEFYDRTGSLCIIVYCIMQRGYKSNHKKRLVARSYSVDNESEGAFCDVRATYVRAITG